MSENILTLCGLNFLNNETLSNLTNQGLNYISVTERTKKVWDLKCSNEMITSKIREALYNEKIDFSLQSINKKHKKILFSDMDATILTNETTNELASILGIEEQVTKITDLAMQGKINFEESLKQRLILLKGIDKSFITEQINSISYSPGADKLLKEINNKDIYSVLVSGGFSIYADVVREKLNFSESVANQLSFDKQNKLDGKYIGRLVDENFKLNYLKKLTKEKSISLSETVAIGDGANDIPMLKNAGLGVAFYGKKITREAVNSEIHSGDISNLIWFL